VFGDRLIDDEDRLWLLNHVRDLVKKIFGFNFDNIFSYLDTDRNGKVETVDEIRGLLFGYLLYPVGALAHYEPITDMQALADSCKQGLEHYNNEADKPMDLVLFEFALEHLCRISRILNQEGGNALLIGVGGSGRSSVSRLAAYMAEMDIV
jgi:dynein heavy chain